MIVYGHRGAKGEAPENTMVGFAHAYRHGIRHFELDLVLSRDGVPVINHDLTLARTTGHQGRVADLTTAELAALDARSNTAPWPTATGIPALTEFLEAFPDLAHVQLEVKSDSRNRLNVLCNRITELIQRNHLVDRVAITSSDTWFLQQTKRRDRTIRTGLVAERRFPNPVKQAIRLDCDYLCVNWRICSADMVKAAHQRDLHVSAWTVNRIHDMLELENVGVDSIITDYPTSTLMYFQNRPARSQARLADQSSSEGRPATSS